LQSLPSEREPDVRSYTATGCGNDQEVVARRIYADEMVSKQFDVKGRNGLKYRTLCKKCNGEVIGSRDEALGKFALAAEPLAAPAPDPVRSVNANIRPAAVLRAILGHFVAAKTQTTT
jgi:hypothetical protein